MSQDDNYLPTLIEAGKCGEDAVIFLREALTEIELHLAELPKDEYAITAAGGADVQYGASLTRLARELDAAAQACRDLKELLARRHVPAPKPPG